MRHVALAGQDIPFAVSVRGKAPEEPHAMPGSGSSMLRGANGSAGPAGSPVAGRTSHPWKSATQDRAGNDFPVWRPGPSV